MQAMFFAFARGVCLHVSIHEPGRHLGPGGCETPNSELDPLDFLSKEKENNRSVGPVSMPSKPILKAQTPWPTTQTMWAGQLRPKALYGPFWSHFMFCRTYGTNRAVIT